MVDLAAPQHVDQQERLIERMLTSTQGLFDIAGIYLGDQLGMYHALTELGWANSRQLADRAGLNERYVREWLEQQTVYGIIEVRDAAVGPTDRLYCLPEGHVEVLTDRESLNYLAPLAQIALGVIPTIRDVRNAFKTGGGIRYGDFHIDMHEGQAGMNRNLFLYQLGQEYLPVMEDVHARLSATEPAKIADIGCGFGWSSIGMAKAYDNANVDGFDLDAGSVAVAQELVREHGLDGRVSVEVRDAGDPALAGQYDLVTAFECIHDMSDPVSALATMRRLAGPDGVVLVMDERANERFSADGSDVERIFYGFSLLHCLPAGMADQPSVGTGTVMRPDTFKGYALAAGFNDVEILPIDNYFFNFYRLHQ